MPDKKPEGHALVVMATGAFLGGLIAGGTNSSVWESVVVILIASYGALILLGHIDKNDWTSGIGTMIGLSTMIPLPCGFVGFWAGKSLWG